MPVDVGGIKLGGEHHIRENLLRMYNALDPNSGTTSTFHDLSGNGNDSNGGTTPTWSNYYYDFDGSDDFFQFPATNFGISDPFTFEIWVYFDAVANPRGGVFMQGLTTDSYGFDQSGGNLRFGVRPGSTLYKVEHAITTSEWLHYMGTYEGTGNGSTLTLYHNGTTTVGTATMSEASTLSVGGENLLMGHSNIMGGNTAGADRINGRIACGRIYDRELTKDEAIYNFNVDRGVFGV